VSFRAVELRIAYRGSYHEINAIAIVLGLRLLSKGNVYGAPHASSGLIAQGVFKAQTTAARTLQSTG
jgi:hypothetical protein